MAFSVGQIEATIGANMKPFQQAMEKVRNMGANLTRSLTLPLAAIGGAALKTAADYETLRQSMDILNGSAEEGARNFERLKKFSAKTPFQLRDLAEAQNMLQGFGMEADNAFESIQNIGDIAAVTGGDIKGIGRAFGQAAAEGRLMTRDILQLINQGVPATKLLAETMGVAQGEIFNLASEGKISFDILQESFRNATSEGGMFADGMKKQSETLAGTFSTLKDNISNALAEIGDSISETFDVKGILDGLIESIQKGIKWFNSLSDEVRKGAFTMAAILGAAGPVMTAIGALSLAIGAISAPIAGVVAAVGIGAVAMVKHWEDVEFYFTSGGGKTMWTDLQATVKETTEAMKKLWNSFGDDLITIAEYSMGKILSTIENIVWATSLLAKAANLTVGAFQNVGMVFASAFGDGDEQVNKTNKSMKELLESSQKLFDFIGADFKIGVTPKDSENVNELAKSIARVRVASSAPVDKIINPADITQARILKEEFQLFNDALYNAATFTMDFSHRMTNVSEKSVALANAMSIATGIANTFTSSFGSGLTNVIVEGEKLIKVLENVGKLLLSSAIQKGLSILLTGGLSGSGYFGSKGGLIGGAIRGIGKAFGVSEGAIPTASAQETSMTRAFKQAMDQKFQELTPEAVWVMGEKGRLGV